MPDFFVTPTAVFHPTACLTCGTSADPLGFIDGGVDELPYGHVYLCGSCALQAGARFGMLAPGEATDLEDTIAGLRAELDQTVAQLAEERDRIIVSRADLRAIVAEGRPLKAKEPTR